MRSQSIFEMDVDLNLKVSNYEETVRQLDVYYGIGKVQFIIHRNQINLWKKVRRNYFHVGQ